MKRIINVTLAGVAASGTRTQPGREAPRLSRK